MADKVRIPPEAPGSASELAAGVEAQKSGLPAAMALIVGSIIGVGIFTRSPATAAGPNGSSSSAPYQVNAGLMGKAHNPAVKFMYCLPACHTIKAVLVATLA
jgi:hypothetical protein